MPDSISPRDHDLLARCRELAQLAAGAGNTAVGSLIAIDGAIVAEAEEETPGGPDPFAHAELVAVKRAMRELGRRKIPEATLYTNVEPCFMCSYAIREARIGCVVIGWPTPQIGGADSQYPLLASADIDRWGEPPEIVWALDERNKPNMLRLRGDC